MRRALLGCLVTACAADPAVAPVAVADDAALLVMATAANDYSVGALTVMDLADPGPTEDVATLHGDAVVVVEDGYLWAINRLLMDTVRRYEPGDWAAPLLEVSTGVGSNPHDVAVCGGLAFASPYERDHLVIFDPVTGADRGTVDLSAYADDDGVPEVSDLVVWQGRLFAGLQRLARLDGWSTDPGGKVVEVDCDTGAVVKAWDVGPNPGLVGDADTLWVVGPEGVRPMDGEGVGAPVLTDVAGAVVVDLAVGPDGRGALVARRDGVHTLGCVDTGTWEVRVAEALPHYVSDVVVDEGTAWFAVRQSWQDPDTRGGLVGVDLAGCEVVTPEGGIASTFPPFSLAIWR